MWIEFSKLVLCFYFCSTVAHAYQSKVDYINHHQRYPQKNAVSGLYNYKLSTSRYPNLEKVKSRIENMNNDGGSTGSKDLLARIRHKGWSYYRPKPTTTTTTTTENSLFETYGDLDGDEDFEDYDDNLEDEDSEADYEDETEDPFFTNLSGFQAEEPTERPVISKPVSSFTEYKWRRFGSVSDVAESRRNHLQVNRNPEHFRVNAVVEHSSRVNRQGMCEKPSPKVIPVHKEHPDPSKTYTPHCTILHRCGEDTGCCKYDTTCQYKTRVLVQLYFYVTTLGSVDTKVEMLSFYNHTECECRETSNNETSTETPEENSSTLSFKSSNAYKPSTYLEKCNCPKHFKVTPSLSYNSCTCDCEEENPDCVQLKQGNEHFRMADRICISNNECTTPVCEYGVYSRSKGKCPSLSEKLMEYRRIGVNY